MEKIYPDKQALISDLVRPEDAVLDVGFWGQGVGVDSSHWVHRLLEKRAREVYGLDRDFDEARLPGDLSRYQKGDAENFSFPRQFDVIFAGDLIEHLSNPGLFLGSAARSLSPGGRLILTTPNCFSFFSLTEKLVNPEPTVNRDHTCYYNRKTLAQMLAKNGWEIESQAWLYALEVGYKESWRKKMLNVLYRFLSRFTPKYLETMVVVARPRRA